MAIPEYRAKIIRQNLLVMKAANEAAGLPGYVNLDHPDPENIGAEQIKKLRQLEPENRMHDLDSEIPAYERYVGSIGGYR